jgi:hypothetical protein
MITIPLDQICKALTDLKHEIYCWQIYTRSKNDATDPYKLECCYYFKPDFYADLKIYQERKNLDVKTLIIPMQWNMCFEDNKKYDMKPIELVMDNVMKQLPIDNWTSTYCYAIDYEVRGTTFCVYSKNQITETLEVILSQIYQFLTQTGDVPKIVEK